MWATQRTEKPKLVIILFHQIFYPRPRYDTTHAVPYKVQDHCLFVHVIFYVILNFIMESFSHFLDVSFSASFITPSRQIRGFWKQLLYSTQQNSHVIRRPLKSVAHYDQHILLVVLYFWNFLHFFLMSSLSMVFYFALDVRDSFKVLSSLIVIRLWDKILFLKRFLGRFRINRSFFK